VTLDDDRRLELPLEVARHLRTRLPATVVLALDGM
jgi:hypothetical protein